jgi:DNA-binding winged helix-turn-helix (wHTH) protein
MPSTDDTSGYRLCVRAHEHVVAVCGREVDLTPREYEIISTLYTRPGWVFSAEQLSGDSDDADYSPESVSVLVSRLRHKLSEVGAPDAIETVRGFGYRLRAQACEGGEAAAMEAAEASNPLRDASWDLQEAVLAVEHAGTDDERRIAVEALEAARRVIEAELED